MLVGTRTYSNFDEMYRAINGSAKKFDLTALKKGEKLEKGFVGIRLTAVQKVEQTTVVKRSVDGRSSLVSVTLTPGKIYAVPAEEKVFLDDIQTKIGWIKQTPENENLLKEAGVEYEIKKGCSSCRGSRPTIRYKLVEVVESA